MWFKFISTNRCMNNCGNTIWTSLLNRNYEQFFKSIFWSCSNVYDLFMLLVSLCNLLLLLILLCELYCALVSILFHCKFRIFDLCNCVGFYFFIVVSCYSIIKLILINPDCTCEICKWQMYKTFTYRDFRNTNDCLN